MTGGSALYFGGVVHQRHRPKKHHLNYRVFSVLLDLDELESLDGSLKLFGYNRRAVFSFWDKDHGCGEKGGLRAWVRQHLASAGIANEGLRVRVLCYPRIFGYVFNPLTVYFCEDDQGRLLALLYEVCNTFMERHTYVIPAAGITEGSVRHSCSKAMYVSPFVPMDCTYDFDIAPPTERVKISISERDQEGKLLYASFSGERSPLTDATLSRALFAYPLMTMKVMAGIHWEALRLWLKGVPIHRHRPAENRIASSVEHPVLSGGTQT
ncbi:DUF1365 domain-containing protein [Rhizobium sp. SL86]|uniref:DUF1365 domain-containing protein n=1 Tax=Rhizobium sp. SL86 TaxID=2995148 RepID=UPI002275206D|nr:DUF1365 domain-containing protein [Rhizobium sp. SL86]MCY1665159.1 DUF1365 domain-containing protein [Rhizobium sp. SL86]